MTVLYTGEVQVVLIPGKLWVVFSFKNDGVGMERFNEGQQSGGGCGPISHRGHLSKLLFFISKVERMKEKLQIKNKK